MGDSKRPLYAFVDETGNTGHNLFDESQPDFFTAALVTKGNFDVSFGGQVKALAESLGVISLHGNVLGAGRLEDLAIGLLSILRRANAAFFVSRVEKRYLLATKVFDSIFDSGENAAVAWHHYNVRPLRLVLTFKLAAAIEVETAKQFWQCILEQNEKKCLSLLSTVCDALLRNLDRIPDQKSRQVLGEGLEWARDHPESIQIHTDKKLARQGHFPNMVAFANLLDGLEHFSRERKSRVARITHDRQSEFEQTLKMWHGMFSNAPEGPGRWAGETYSFQKVVGSEFEVREDSDSAGIQVVDVVLWLYAQFRKGKPLPPGCARVLDYALSNGWENDFSFNGVSRLASQRFGEVLSKPLDADQETAARALIDKAEAMRKASMAQYEQDGLPPFMRSSRKEAITADVSAAQPPFGKAQ